jgi:ubiquinone/menaquinone biosynthesis C-methylase UbiE
MDKPKSDLDFRVMSFMYKFRDLFSPRTSVLKEVGIQPGFRVLDYGCGLGSYIVALAEMVGSSGKIYALDIHPFAIQTVKRLASNRGLINVKTIQSDCKTGLPDSSIDVVLLYDTFHDLSEPNNVLRELHRVLRPTGILSFSDHHMKDADILSRVTAGDLFKLSSRGNKTYTFDKVVNKNSKEIA